MLTYITSDTIMITTSMPYTTHHTNRLRPCQPWRNAHANTPRHHATSWQSDTQSVLEETQDALMASAMISRARVFWCACTFPGKLPRALLDVHVNTRVAKTTCSEREEERRIIAVFRMHTPTARGLSRREECSLTVYVWISCASGIACQLGLVVVGES